MKELSEFYSQEKTKNDGSIYIYYRPDCIECVKNKSLSWADENREKWLAKCIRQNNKPDVRVKQNAAKKEHRESGKYREWQRNNPEKIKNSNKKYSNKKHKITKTEWSDCKTYFGYACAYCGMSWEEHKFLLKQDLHKEHVDDEGLGDLSNCVPSCKPCNSSKHNYDFLEWFKSRVDIYSDERFNKIMTWINNEYKLYINEK